jgi:hypothetical protein
MPDMTQYAFSIQLDGLAAQVVLITALTFLFFALERLGKWIFRLFVTPAALPARQLTKRDVFWLGWAPTHRHYKGGHYEEMTRAIATDPIEAGETVVTYVHESGSTYVRPARLFDQPERFTALDGF